MKILRRICMAFFVLVGLIGLGEPGLAQEGPGEAISFTLNDVSGKPVSMDEYLGKGPVLLVFFATWCPACKEEVPLLEVINKDYGKQIAIFAIDIKEDASKVNAFIKKGKITYKTLLDADGKVAEEYRVRGIPTIVLIDTARKVLYYGHDLREAKRNFPASTKTQAPPIKTPTGVEKYLVSKGDIGLKVTCPVMGKQFKVTKNTPAAKYKDKIYYFCCRFCPKAFDKDPEKYIIQKPVTSPPRQDSKAGRGNQPAPSEVEG